MNTLTGSYAILDVLILVLSILEASLDQYNNIFGIYYVSRIAFSWFKKIIMWIKYIIYNCLWHLTYVWDWILFIAKTSKKL